MNEMMTEDLRTKFLRIYANLPLGIRKETIAIIDNEPMTWQVCYLEIYSETELGEKILEHLHGLELI